MYRHDLKLSSLAFCILITACQASRKPNHSALPAIFPDAARALGPFTIHLENSRDSRVLSAARVKVEQGNDLRHVTVQIKMLHNQEQITVNFLHADEAQTEAPRCNPPTPSQAERMPPPLQDAAAFFHIPLPRSIREASSLNVTGVGDAWSVVNEKLVWNPKNTKSTHIALTWTRDQSPEVRYPLQSRFPPQNLKARRIDKDSEDSIDVDWEDGFVTMDEADVKSGAWLELQYDIPAQETSFQLPQVPAFGNMNILTLQDNCPREAYLLERDDLSWDCPQNKGALWAVSYSFRQPSDAWDLQDWPELAKQAPNSIQAFADAGETLEVDLEKPGRVIPRIPPEASRICLKATWSSDLPR